MSIGCRFCNQRWGALPQLFKRSAHTILVEEQSVTAVESEANSVHFCEKLWANECTGCLGTGFHSGLVSDGDWAPNDQIGRLDG